MCLPHRGMEWNRATGFHFSSQLSVFPGDGTRSTSHFPEELISRLVIWPQSFYPIILLALWSVCSFSPMASSPTLIPGNRAWAG